MTTRSTSFPSGPPTGEWVAYLGRALQLPPHLVRLDGTGLRKLADRAGYRGVMQPIDKGTDGHSERSDIHTWSPDGTAWTLFLSISFTRLP